VKHATVTTKDRRTAFELALMRGLLAKDLPILGICGGQQLLAVALGGTLVQHLPDEIPSDIPHEQPNPRTEAGHEVIVAADTLLHRIVGQERIPVNSAHHQAVKAVPASILVNASAPDGVIEGIEDPSRRFCLGVQWHPEYHISPADRAIFNALIAASAA
jgi:putative glutamine amidotransferase